MRTLLLGVALASGLGCGDPESIHRPPPPDQAEEEAPPETNEPLTEPPEPDLPPLPDLDDMNRSDLEAACFEGSQAACDRLGH